MLAEHGSFSMQNYKGVAVKLEITKDEYISALLYLDMLLAEQKLSIGIKAIGGFALLWHSIRGTGYTADIDSVTKDFPPEVIECIEKTAAIFDFPTDWVNNYNVFENDVDSIELMIDPFWEKADIGTTAVKLWIADLETLLRSKLLAAEDSESSGRAQDFPDLMDLFSKIGCFSVKACSTYVDENMDISLLTDYPNVLKLLRNATFPRGRCLNTSCAMQRAGVNVCAADSFCQQRIK